MTDQKRPDSFDVPLQDSIGNEQQILCPLCGCEYVHLIGPVEHRHSDDYTANPKVRGNVIVMPGWCEEECKFLLFLGFHKGYTHLWGEERRYGLPEDVHQPEFPQSP